MRARRLHCADRAYQLVSHLEPGSPRLHFPVRAAFLWRLGRGGPDAWPIAPSLLLAAAVTSPAWLGIFREGGQGGQLGDPLGDNLANSADLLGFVLPSSAHPLWGHAIDSVRMALFGPNDNVVENTVFLGFVPLTLAFVGWREARSAEARPFRWVWIVFIVLSIGPCLRVLGHTVRIGEWAVPMPYLLLYHLPTERWRTRRCASSWWRDRARRSRGPGCAACAGPQGPFSRLASGRGGCLALFETAAVPYPLAAVRIPAVYDHLTGPASGVVLEAPIPDWPAQLPQRMLYQTRHGHPVFGGYLSRSLPPQPFETLPGFARSRSSRWTAPISITSAAQSCPPLPAWYCAPMGRPMSFCSRMISNTCPGSTTPARRHAAFLPVCSARPSTRTMKPRFSQWPIRKPRVCLS
jgi:hypothetical protein